VERRVAGRTRAIVVPEKGGDSARDFLRNAQNL
jgi:hypothetical protein